MKAAILKAAGSCDARTHSGVARIKAIVRGLKDFSLSKEKMRDRKGQ
jgi:hypothetical protein